MIAQVLPCVIAIAAAAESLLAALFHACMSFQAGPNPSSLNGTVYHLMLFRFVCFSLKLVCTSTTRVAMLL